MNVVQHRLTQSRCLALIEEKEHRVATRLMKSMDQRNNEAVDVTVKTNVRIRHSRRLLLLLNMLPILNEKGRVDSYFGLCRDISKESATAEKLELEKAKAQEVENVKNAFLHNMSYEIRTPFCSSRASMPT